MEIEVYLFFFFLQFQIQGMGGIRQRHFCANIEIPEE
jgi:hypothetical protein